MPAFFTLVIIFLFSAVFAFLGAVVLRRLVRNVLLPMSLYVGGGYFVGAAIFLVFWRTLAWVMGNARVSFWVTVALLLVWLVRELWVYIWRVAYYIRHLSIKAIIAAGSVMVFIFCLELGLWLQTTPTPGDPFENFGSAHSVRYTNIANYIVSANRIPILNQNIGQSMLASVPLFFGAHAPYIALYALLSISIFFLSVLVYGLLKYFTVRRAALGTFLFMFGNTALSLTHVLSLDSNSPFAMSSYTDATCAVGTFLVFLFLFVRAMQHKLSLKLIVATAFLLGVYWNFSGPQNLYAALAMLGILFLWYVYKKSTERLLVFLIALAFFAALIVGVFQGGMFTPEKFQDNVTIPGAAQVYRPGEYTGIKPELPYGIGWAYHGLHYGTPYDPETKALYVSILRAGKSVNGEIVYNIIWQLETNAWDALRVMFFPLLGLVLFYFVSKNSDRFSELRGWWLPSVVIFATCFALAFTVIVSGRKWEMSRFMMEAYALGMFLFAVSFLALVDRLPKPKSTVVLWLVTVLVTIGPVVNAIGIVNWNFADHSIAKAKLKSFPKDVPLFGQEIWNNWIEKGIIQK